MFERAGSVMDRKNKGEQGFTLIEMLIVIIIIGILAGVVIFAVGNLTNDTKKNACATEADTFVTAIQAYRASNSGAFPDANGGTAGVGTVAGVGGVLNTAGLLSKATVKFGVDGAAAAGQSQWGFDNTTGAVTPEPAQCVGS